MQEDYFMKVARRKILEREEIEDIEPLPLNAELISAVGESFPPLLVKPYEERLKQFKRELGEMKNKYVPFLGNYVPPYETGKNYEAVKNKAELKEFLFRYETSEDLNDFSNVLNGRGEWEKIVLPDYRGPVGRWRGYYLTSFNINNFFKKTGNKKIFARFLGVDYIATVYINNRCVGRNEGFFCPFEFDITDYLDWNKENVLVVQVENDFITHGMESWVKGLYVDGDKIYAATGLGYDDAEIGWHHCPPGAGIYNSVFLEERPPVFISSAFVRPDIDREMVEIWVDIHNCLSCNVNLDISIDVYPRNFTSFAQGTYRFHLNPAGPGTNNYRVSIPVKDMRLWDTKEPWLYTARIVLAAEGKTCDFKDCIFGMRKFHMDEEEDPKGTLYLNNKKIFLRGSNDMGNMQLCVFRKNFNQLIDDILIAKMANLNYFRFTQRPVQEEIYHYCDMLGMMSQTDLPLFGRLRRNQFCEAIRQAVEMERLIRNHPSAIMISYINEAENIEKHKLEHRHLNRNELEDFFDAATLAVHVQNPDRVIKRVEGDYDPPTREGLHDFHCYNMWYTNHMLPMGKLYKGYLPKIKKGWKTGCGEFGVEGLDRLELMENYCPSEWLPKSGENLWYPDVIPMAQTFEKHADWFPKQHNIKSWIYESQKHQAFAIKLMADSFRRRADRIVSTAVHLLIDAWPTGWMKALVGVDRVPKPAYFAYMDAMKPVRVNLRTDRWRLYEGDELNIEIWLLNDTHGNYKNVKIQAVLRDDKKDYKCFEGTADIPGSASRCAYVIKEKVPQDNENKSRKKMHVDCRVLDENEQCLDAERFTLEIFKKYEFKHIKDVFYIGNEAYWLLNQIGIKGNEVNDITSLPQWAFLMISDFEPFEKDGWLKEKLASKIRDGLKAIFLAGEGKVQNIYLDGEVNIIYNTFYDPLFFVEIGNESPFTSMFEPMDFSYFYNFEADLIDFTVKRFFVSMGMEFYPLLYSFSKSEYLLPGEKAESRKKIVAGIGKYGKGFIIISTLINKGRIGYNPTIDMLYGNILTGNYYKQYENL